jgi:O-antigen/teichoic acid export membrane protein
MKPVETSLPQGSAETSSALKSVVKGAGLVLVGLAISKAMSYFLRLVLARLGPEQYGLFTLGLTVFDFATFLTSLSLLTAVLRYAPEYHALGNNKRLLGVFSDSVKLIIAAGIAGSAILYFSADAISTIVFHQPALAGILRIMSFAIVFYNLSGVVTSLARALNRVEYEVALKMVVENAFKLALAATAVAMGLGLAGVTAGFSIAIFLTCLVSFYAVEKKVYPFVAKATSGAPIESTARQLLTFSLPLTADGLVWMVAASADIIVIGIFLGAAQVGIYGTALPTAAFLTVIPLALQTMFKPLTVGLLAKKKTEDVKRVYYTLSKWVFAANLAVLLPVVVFATQIIAILFGRDYGPAALPLSILSTGFFLSQLLRIGEEIVVAYDRTVFLLANAVVAVAIAGLAQLLLVPHYGIAGAAVGAALTWLAMGFGIWYKARRLTGFSPFAASKYLHITLSGGIAVGASYLLAKYFLAADVFGAIVILVSFVAVYAICLRGLKVADEYDIEVGEAITRKLGIKINVRKILTA